VQSVGEVRQVDGFTGSAIGRSIWQGPLGSYYGGRAGREETVAQIATGLARLVQAYEGS
jgi:hypothetical protein